ncbi:MAG: hypothetical protein ACYSTI_06430 [Planctomycetota bacterium]|jgi:hypothetical protein
MAATTHFNLPKLPTGPVDWVAVYNSLLDILEAGRTVKMTAGEALTGGLAFYIKSDGKAWLGTPNTEIHGIWQSSSTATSSEGFGQTAGIIIGAWTWTPGALIYVSSGGALTENPTARLVGFAISATIIYIQPENRGALLKYQTDTGITAFAGGGQGSATQLTSSVNVIATCATAGDSVKMPAAAVGLRVLIINNGAASCNVFPASGDNLGAGVDTAVALAAGNNIEYLAIDSTNWETI